MIPSIPLNNRANSWPVGYKLSDLGTEVSVLAIIVMMANDNYSNVTTLCRPRAIGAHEPFKRTENGGGAGYDDGDDDRDGHCWGRLNQ